MCKPSKLKVFLFQRLRIARRLFGVGGHRSGISGYVSATSVLQGSTISFHISSLPASAVRISIVRVGAEDVLVHTASAAVSTHVTPPRAYEVGCNWPPCYTLSVPTSWPSSLYRADLVNDTVNRTSIHFIVKAARHGITSPILLQFAAATGQAYNDWGGKDLYPSHLPDRARKVSFNRPGGLDYRWESAFLRWLERNGFAVECCTSLDLHEDPDGLSGYQLLLSVGHDEYWSKEMRDNVERFIDNGGNVAFFSGNVCWWQVRFEDGNRTMVCYKSVLEDPESGVDNSRVTVEWHSVPVARPENSLTGVSFRNGAGIWQPCSSSMGEKAYQVRFANHWVFEGTGLNDNDAFGRGENIVGYETDAAEYVEADGIPRVTGRDGTPPTFVILATADLRDWLPCGKGGHATMGIYHRTGTVFTAATTDWANGFQFLESAVHQITRNVVSRLSHPYPRDSWEVIGHAKDVVAMAAMEGKLFATTRNNVLWWREPIGQNVTWERIGYANDVVAMAALNGALFAVTRNGTLWWGEPVGRDVNWERMGEANNIVALAAANGKLFAATRDNLLWWRDAVPGPLNA